MWEEAIPGGAAAKQIGMGKPGTGVRGTPGALRIQGYAAVLDQGQDSQGTWGNDSLKDRQE